MKTIEYSVLATGGAGETPTPQCPHPQNGGNLNVASFQQKSHIQWQCSNLVRRSYIIISQFNRP